MVTSVMVRNPGCWASMMPCVPYGDTISRDIYGDTNAMTGLRLHANLLMQYCVADMLYIRRYIYGGTQLANLSNFKSFFKKL